MATARAGSPPWSRAWSASKRASERLAVGGLGGVQAPGAELQVAEEGAHVGQVTGGAGAGGDRLAHGLERAGAVAVQLAEVGDAGQAGEVGPQVDHALGAR